MGNSSSSKHNTKSSMGVMMATSRFTTQSKIAEAKLTTEWPLIESYLWDVGQTEELESLIDDAVRLLLVDDTFKTQIWDNEENIAKLYDDRTYSEIVKLVIENVDQIKNEKHKFWDENKYFQLKAGFDIEKDDEVDEFDDDEDIPIYTDNNDNEVPEITIQSTDPKSKTHKPSKSSDKLTYFWSFLLAIASTIKYLEIEIKDTPIFEINKDQSSLLSPKQIRENWANGGFVVPPSSGAAVGWDDDFNDDDDSNGNIKMNKMVKQQSRLRKQTIKKMETFMEDIKQNADMKDGEAKLKMNYRIYCEQVRKFVLEFENPEVLDNLWPWYENNKHDEMKGNENPYYKKLYEYRDEVVSIDETKVKENALISLESNQNSILYRNIRYLRKFAAVFMLGDKEIAKDLLVIKKQILKNREDILNMDGDDDDGGGGGASDDLKNDDAPAERIKKAVTFLMDAVTDVVNDDIDMKSMITDTLTMSSTDDDGSNNNKTLSRKDVRIVIDKNDREFLKLQFAGIKDKLYKDDGDSGGSGLGDSTFIAFWNRKPKWWKLEHDQILVELALMFKFDLSAYAKELKENTYYQDFIDDLGPFKAFTNFVSQKVNILHRLRLVMFVLENDLYPKSVTYCNEYIEWSHKNELYEKNNEKKNDDDKPKKQDLDEMPVRDIFEELRDVIQLLNPEQIGDDMWLFIIDQIKLKQKASLWKILQILAEELPTNRVLELMEQYEDEIRRGKPAYVHAVCQGIIRGSTYPIATALHMSLFMEELSTKDLSKGDKWMQFSKEYEEIANFLVNEIESDFLLALLLEIPTDIMQKTTIELAITYQRIEFMNNARISGIMRHLWNSSEYLNPMIPMASSELSHLELFNLLVKQPVRFYYCPLGLYCTTAVLYVVYLLLVSYVTYKQVYPYYPWNESKAELLMWFCNAGYIAYELAEIEGKRASYLALDSIQNLFDILICLNWVLLFVIRFWGGAKPFYLDPDIHYELYTSEYSPESHNTMITMMYMFFWSLQIVVLWFRVIGLLQRTELMGPLLRMTVIVVKDVFKFLIMCFVAIVGFMLSMYFIVAGDLERDIKCYDDEWLETLPFNTTSLAWTKSCSQVSQPLNSIKGCSMYLFQTALGQHDWDVLDENALYYFNRGRAQLATLVMIAYILVAGIILFNMLIAIMTTTFDQMHSQLNSFLIFLRAESTYDLAHRGRLMPPPMNLVVLLMWVVYSILEWIVTFFCRCLSKPKIFNMNPLFWFNDGQEVSMVVAHKDHYAEKSQKADDKDNSTPKKYCKHCYCRMGALKAGKIEQYFEFVVACGYMLDAQDTEMISRIFRYSALCPSCFRPYCLYSSDGTLMPDRHDRYHVLLDVFSCYVFVSFVWIPLILSLAIPAAISKMFGSVQDKQANANKNKNQLGGAFGDYHKGSHQRTVIRIVDAHGDDSVFDVDLDNNTQ